MTTPISPARRLLHKVPEITVYFWIIKVLCTTVGETAADFLNTTLNLGLTGTTYVMGALLLIALFFQFRAKKYHPAPFWLVVVLISVVGTLITDNLTDKLGISLATTTIVFGASLVVVFAVWYGVERTLSMESIRTTRREAFYWLAVLFTFALGTAAGDLIAETYKLGYPLAAALFAGAIAIVAIARYAFKLNGVLAFWIAYILTRPLGASMGDWLSQDPADGGLGVGTVVTSAIFLLAILATVIYLIITKKDATPEVDEPIASA